MFNKKQPIKRPQGKRPTAKRIRETYTSLMFACYKEFKDQMQYNHLTEVDAFNIAIEKYFNDYGYWSSPKELTDAMENNIHPDLSDISRQVA